MDKIIQLKDSSGQINLFPNSKSFQGIDPTNVIAEIGGYELSYTATQDCWVVCGYYHASSNNLSVKLNGIDVPFYTSHISGDYFDGTLDRGYFNIPMKKDQVLSVTWANAYNRGVRIKVFGYK